MSGMIGDLMCIKDAVARALECFCYIAKSQLFLDGNKRVAQLLANKVLIENGVGVFQIPVEYCDNFKELLVRYYESGVVSDIIPFMEAYCIRRV